MYEVKPTSRFKKDLRTIAGSGRDISPMIHAVKLLAQGIALPARYRDHDLKGEWLGHRECHIAPDWLLIYKKHEDILVLTLTRTGTHSDLFKK